MSCLPINLIRPLSRPTPQNKMPPAYDVITLVCGIPGPLGSRQYLPRCFVGYLWCLGADFDNLKFSEIFILLAKTLTTFIESVACSRGIKPLCWETPI